jgi:hypothetical protein
MRKTMVSSGFPGTPGLSPLTTEFDVNGSWRIEAFPLPIDEYLPSA